jgi:hypothetical protein
MQSPDPASWSRSGRSNAYNSTVFRRGLVREGPGAEEFGGSSPTASRRGFSATTRSAAGLDEVELSREDFYTYLVERSIDLVDPCGREVRLSQRLQVLDLRDLWIKQTVTRAVANTGRTIRIPIHMVGRLNKVRQTQRQLVQRLGREPRPDEIAEEVELATEEVQEILRMAQFPVSLEKPIGDKEDTARS